MQQSQIDFLKNALRGNDFDDKIITELLQALNELEELQALHLDNITPILPGRNTTFAYLINPEREKEASRDHS
uniref:Uncharacterized protein n=1 Tax=viral metagenome TaxID=1070528 RepID=A0A6M3LUP4_9ZZZZ